MASEKREYTFAQTFPTGTHAMWLYYWLAAYGINPMKDAKIITVPPPQMVANMRVGNMDGFCVGEPWGHRAIIDGIGITARDHAGHLEGPSGEGARHHRRLRQEVPEHRARDDRRRSSRPASGSTPACRTRRRWPRSSPTSATSTPASTSINQRILGRYQNGLGKTWDDPNHMKFYNDGAVNFPYLSDGMWFLTQHKRWGLLKEDPDYLGGGQADQPDRPLQAGRRARRRSAVPKDPMRTSKLIDGVVWDGKDPKKYADVVQGPR